MHLDGLNEQIVQPSSWTVDESRPTFTSQCAQSPEGGQLRDVTVFSQSIADAREHANDDYADSNYMDDYYSDHGYPDYEPNPTAAPASALEAGGSCSEEDAPRPSADMGETAMGAEQALVAAAAASAIVTPSVEIVESPLTTLPEEMPPGPSLQCRNPHDGRSQATAPPAVPLSPPLEAVVDPVRGVLISMARLVIVLEGTVEEMTDEMEARFLQQLAAFLGIPQNQLAIANKQSGSIILEVDVLEVPGEVNVARFAVQRIHQVSNAELSTALGWTVLRKTTAGRPSTSHALSRHL